MKLHLTEWGTGNGKTALLAHGIVSDGPTWARTALALVDRGYRAVAPDLRGHGLSPRGSYTHREWTEDLLESVPVKVDLAIGHSFGCLVLRRAEVALAPGRIVYLEPSWKSAPSPELRANRIATLRSEKLLTRDEFARQVPRWSDSDVDARMRALERWDPDAADGLVTGEAWSYVPTEPPLVPTMIMLADPSAMLSPDEAADLKELGYSVCTISGAGHSLHRDDLPAVLDEFDDWSRSLAIAAR